MTSEEIFGISKQPTETCPMIDVVIKDITDALLSAKMEKCDNVEELKGALSDVDWAICSAPADLETIRDHVTQIRSWGQDWKDKAKELKNTLEKIEALAQI